MGYLQESWLHNRRLISSLPFVLLLVYFCQRPVMLLLGQGLILRVLMVTIFGLIRHINRRILLVAMNIVKTGINWNLCLKLLICAQILLALSLLHYI